MTVNAHAQRLGRKYGVGYHRVRIAVNRIVNAGWDRPRAEQYVEEVLAANRDDPGKLDRAVEAVLREQKAKR